MKNRKSFRDLDLKLSYDSDEDENIVSCFFQPVLERSVEYLRVTGSFSSSALLIAARGIAGLVINDGKMKLVADAKLRTCDIEAIQSGEELSNVLSKKLLSDLNTIEKEIIQDHIAALGWLVASKKLEIKIIVMVDNKGNVIPAGKSNIMFHPKIGILKDAFGERVSFSGSINESITGWMGNIEEFKVYKSWEEVQKGYLEADLNKFKKYWDGSLKRAKTYDVPEAVKDRLINMAPKSIESMKARLLRWYKGVCIKKEEKLLPDLWKHQLEAIKIWHIADHNGIWQMSTGSGKTLAAIKAAIELHEKLTKSLLVVIVCPYVVIVDQWTKILTEYGQNVWKLDHQWIDKLRKAVNFHLWGSNNITFIVLTYDKLSTPKSLNYLKKCNNAMIIADEVHNFGARNRQAGMIDIFKFRLGLSATPERWFDEEGSTSIKDYFHDIIYQYSLKQAIEDGHLVPYDYYPHIVELNIEESREYIRISSRIKNMAYLLDEENVPDNVKKNLIERAKIIRKASKKSPRLKELISNGLIKLEKTLIYCGDLEQVYEVQNMLNELDIYQHQRYTAQETEKERSLILNKFNTGTIKVLVAIKCLDEGLDIPGIKNAVIMASTMNPREFIQRRGRILRTYRDKEFASIHDFIVIPARGSSFDNDFSQMYSRELQRYVQFTKTSRNPEISASTLLKIRDRISRRE
ncbi:MAG: DEAD/DEAH box helicase family protein [Promethearchaeota archaeon]